MSSALRVVSLASLARSGETVLLRALAAHPQLHVVHDLYAANDEIEQRLYGLLRVWPLPTLPRAELDHHLAPGAVSPQARVLLLKQGVFTPRHRVEGFGLIRNPYAVFCSLWSYDAKLEGLSPTAERNLENWRSRRLPRLLIWVEASLPWLLPALRAEADPVRQFLSYWQARVAQILERHRTVLNYESLVADPQTELCRACEAIDVPYDPAMLQAHRLHRPGELGHGGIDLGAPLRAVPAWQPDPLVDLAPFAQAVNGGPVPAWVGLYDQPAPAVVAAAPAASSPPAVRRHDSVADVVEAQDRRRALASSPPPACGAAVAADPVPIHQGVAMSLNLSHPRAAKPAGHVDLLRSRAMGAAREGRVDEALQLIEVALARPELPQAEVLADLAAVALGSGDLGGAIAASRRALACDPAHASARFTLAMALGATGSIEEALELFRALGRDADFRSKLPELFALATTEAARLRAMVDGRAAPAPAPQPEPVATVSTAEARRAAAPTAPARAFIWGDGNPYDRLPRLVSPRGTEGWYSDHPVFEELIRDRRPRRLAEVGSLRGASAIHIAEMLRKHGVEGELTCVDTFLGSREHFFDNFRHEMLDAGRFHFLDEFLGNVLQAGCADLVTPFPQSSTVAARIFLEAGRKFDFVYLDASHEYKDVLNDLREWWPLVDEGGVLVGDDFEHPWFDVIRAAMEFADEIGRPLKTHRAFASSPIGGRENTKFLIYR